MTPAGSTTPTPLEAFAEIERAFFTDEVGEGAAADWEDRCFFPVRAALQQAAETERLLGEARDALEEWRQIAPIHRNECSPFSERGCTCGLDEARRLTRAVLAAVPPGAGGTQEPTT